MTPEYSGAAPDQPPSYFDMAAGNRYPTISQRMDLYVAQGLIDSSEMFGEHEERVDTAGMELAYALVGYNTDARDIVAIQRCLRFGLQMSRELSGDSPAYLAGLDTLDVLFRKRPASVPPIVASSTDRYLYRRRNLIEVLRSNMKLLTPSDCWTHGQNVISFMLEEADYATYENYVGSEFSEMERELRSMLDRPPDNPKR